MCYVLWEQADLFLSHSSSFLLSLSPSVPFSIYAGKPENKMLLFLACPVNNPRYTTAEQRNSPNEAPRAVAAVLRQHRRAYV